MTHTLISQILPDTPYLHGPLADACRRMTPKRIKVELHPQKIDETADHMQIPPPSCTWTIETDESVETGPLSLMSFIAIWNEKVLHVDGVPIDSTIHNEHLMVAAPFIRPHPSGFLQAIGYDAPLEIFYRSILYPIG